MPKQRSTQSVAVAWELAANRVHSPSEGRGACAPSSHPALFTGVRGIRSLRTSPFGVSRKLRKPLYTCILGYVDQLGRLTSPALCPDKRGREMQDVSMRRMLATLVIAAVA